ncbi:MAG: hypothetical protein EZS28_041153 [Streblomastix strix]|uniref:Uncharacterized protein n=1 Tax=Streblomastix strix TaxID=222440 RepID=A0A5J4TZ61_9EUKA|nr:MAG: hypothetical protein EZS28_041153 [Streblomastix strix]
MHDCWYTPRCFKLAVSKDFTQFYLKDLSIKDIKSGFICGDSKQDPPQEAESLQAKVIVMQHLLQIQNRYTLVLDCDTSHIAFKFTEVPSWNDR